MRYMPLLLVLFGVSLAGCSPRVADDTDQTPEAAEPETLAGVWQITDMSGTNADGDWVTTNVQPSLYMFMDGYYSVMLVRGDEPRPLMPEDITWDTMTLEQYRAVCSGEFFSANSGTYEVSGSSLTTRPMVAKWPNFMDGGSASFTYRIEAGYLHLSSEEDGVTWNARLRRLN